MGMAGGDGIGPEGNGVERNGRYGGNGCERSGQEGT